jgi:hypothetical protein
MSRFWKTVRGGALRTPCTPDLDPGDRSWHPRGMKPMISALLFLAVFQTISPGATEEAKLSPADLLDQAIWWPGDCAQMCDSVRFGGSFAEPPLPAFGTMVHPDYFLSEEMKQRLREAAPDLAGEVVRRLHSFSWEKMPSAPPPAPGLAAIVQARISEISKHREAPGPWTPPNSMVLGGAMLRIIEAADLREALPELLRLEEQLHVLNEAAVTEWWKAERSTSEKQSVVPTVSLPHIETGGWVEWNGAFERAEKESANAAEKLTEAQEPIRSKWSAWERQLLDNLVFQREILGVSLGLLQKTGYKPLRDSLIGRITALGRRREGLKLMQDGGIRGEADLPSEQRKYGLIWDADLGVPRYGAATTQIPWSSKIREEARGLVQGFLKAEPIAGLTDGAAILEESIATPGSWNQMCWSGPPISSGVPIPPWTWLARRHFNLGDDTIIRLQACRDLVIPALSERLQTISLETQAAKQVDKDSGFSSERSGQNSRTFGPLLLQVVECLSAVECLPDLLRLEQQLSDIIARAESDAAAPLPDLVIDSPATSDLARAADESPDALRKHERATAMLVCKIYQRELLALIKTLLEREAYAPIRSSTFVRTQQEEGRKQLLEKVAEIKSDDNIPSFLTKQIAWDPEAKKARAKEGAVMPVEIPYTNAIREEIRGIAGRYLKEVPPEKRKAGDGMVLSWLENE